ncbi:oligosaccharyl transferase STT3 subunit [Anopheles sinensis]|uniref:Oligosaccharyl transferase STT3 subunit n=1 Tax=Anopheles sinensis TaxID=74873 RepID=A0A084W241_ANOSI|nr:oligosaccharyl transferase STT3 subunit [Anopheles sinensis]
MTIKTYAITYGGVDTGQPVDDEKERRVSKTSPSSSKRFSIIVARERNRVYVCLGRIGDWDRRLGTEASPEAEDDAMGVKCDDDHVSGSIEPL